MKINYSYKKTSILTLLITFISITGCEKYVDIPAPIDSIPATQVFNTDGKADAVIRGLYVDMVASTNIAFGNAVTIGLGLSSDELTTGVATYNDFFINTVSSTSLPIYNYYWGPMYNMIYVANAAIENINASTGMTDAGKTRYLAEAKFIRAANYFYLVNMFGDVPMPTGSDYTVNALLARAPAAQIYNLMIEDLKFAQANLSATYLNATQRFRANRYAASALLARVYLYNQDYVNAEAAASDVIDGAGSSTYSLETTLTNSFLITSKEAILELQSPATNLYVWDAFSFVPSAVTTIPGYLIPDALYTSFEAGDLRKTNWIRSVTISAKVYNSPYKYKVNTGTTTTGTRTEALVFLRLSEQYLIRAEARAQQTGKLASAIADVDVVRKRAGITQIAVTRPTITQADLLTVIAHERFVELFAEMGHRWFDLKRTGQADIVLKNKPNWRPEAKLFPIPNGDMLLNPNLTQNPGYN